MLVSLVSRFSRFFVWQTESPETLLPIIPQGWNPDFGPEREHSIPSPSDSEPAGTNPIRSPSTSPPPPGRGPHPRGGRPSGGFRFSSARIAPNGNRIYILDFETGIPQIWALERTDDYFNARRINWSDAPHGTVSMALSPDGKLLALGQKDGEIVFVETETLIQSGVIPPVDPDGGPVQALAFSPDGLSLAAAPQHRPIFVWTMRTTVTDTEARIIREGQDRLRLPVHRTPVRILAFDHDGTHLAGASTSDPLVEVWNLDEIQRELCRLGLRDSGGPTGQVQSEKTLKQ
jgi:WD40 repeat protein